MTATAEMQALKERHKAIWAAGDYETVADRLVLDLGRQIVARTGVGPGAEVLDVATGTGNAAIPAAAAGARVVGLDLVPDLLAAAGRRAEAAGVDVEWVEGDAENLPFEDESFDAVLSTLGVQFVPRHEATARELARVCRPGGLIGLSNWTPEGYIGRLFATLAPYMPPPPDGASPPPLWGREEHVEKLFAGTGVSFEFERGTVDFEHDSAATFVGFMAANYGPLVKARESLAPQGRWDDLHRDLVALSGTLNAAGPDSFRTPSEYLLAIGRKAA